LKPCSSINALYSSSNDFFWWCLSWFLMYSLTIAKLDSETEIARYSSCHSNFVANDLIYPPLRFIHLEDSPLINCKTSLIHWSFFKEMRQWQCSSNPFMVSIWIFYFLEFWRMWSHSSFLNSNDFKNGILFFVLQTQWTIIFINDIASI